MLGLAAASAAAQTFSSSGELSRPAAVKKPKPITIEKSLGLRLNTDGWSAFFDWGNIRSEDEKNRDKFYNVRLGQIEFEEHKDPKEVKRAITEQTGGSEKTKPFIFGKVANFYALKIGYGMRRLIAGKPEEGTVSIHWVYAGGLSLGMAKPYYLDGYIVQDNTGVLAQATFKYTDETKESFLNPAYIRGGAGFSKGLNEISFVPGIHAKTALHFDFASSRYTAMALETGVNAECYTHPVTIMANQDAKPYFVNLFAAFQFGYRR